MTGNGKWRWVRDSKVCVESRLTGAIKSLKRWICSSKRELLYNKTTLWGRFGENERAFNSKLLLPVQMQNFFLWKRVDPHIFSIPKQPILLKTIKFEIIPPDGEEFSFVNRLHKDNYESSIYFFWTTYSFMNTQRAVYIIPNTLKGIFSDRIYWN